MRGKNILHRQFKYYPLLAISYAVCMITAQACAYRLLQIGPFVVPGGIFVFPATFVISDIISEVYGPTLARRAIVFTLFAHSGSHTGGLEGYAEIKGNIATYTELNDIDTCIITFNLLGDSVITITQKINNCFVGAGFFFC